MECEIPTISVLLILGNREVFYLVVCTSLLNCMQHEFMSLFRKVGDIFVCYT